MAKNNPLTPFGWCYFVQSFSLFLLLGGAVVPSLPPNLMVMLPPLLLRLGGGASPPPRTHIVHIHNVNLRRTQT